MNECQQLTRYIKHLAESANFKCGTFNKHSSGLIGNRFEMPNVLYTHPLWASFEKKVEARNHFKKQNKLKINSMKKYFLLVPIIGLTFSCSGEKKQTEKSPEEFQEKIEVIENSTQKLDETIEKSESEIEKKQNEIDSLLKNI